MTHHPQPPPRHWLVRLKQEGPNWADIAKVVTGSVLAVVAVAAAAEAGIVGSPEPPPPSPTVSSSVPPWVQPAKDDGTNPTGRIAPGVYGSETTEPPAPEPEPEPTEYVEPETEAPSPNRRIVHPGSYCSGEGAIGWTVRGVRMECRTSSTDTRLRWRRAN